MNIDFVPLAEGWALLAFIVVLLAGYRKYISIDENETLHLDDPAESRHQVAIAQKLEVIDKWGKLFTAIAAVYGLLLTIAYTYQIWVQATNLGA
jgi:hypothetical protein